MPVKIIFDGRSIPREHRKAAARGASMLKHLNTGNDVPSPSPVKIIDPDSEEGRKIAADLAAQFPEMNIKSFE